MSPDGKHVWIAHRSSLGAVSVIDTSHHDLLATVPLDAQGFARDLALTPDGDRAYVTQAFSSKVWVIDTASRSVRGTVDVAYNPFGVAVSPDGTTAYVVNRAPGSTPSTVSVIRTLDDTVIATLTVGPLETEVVFDRFGTFAYVSGKRSTTLSVIETTGHSVIASLPFGGAPAVRPDGSAVYLAQEGSRTVTVIDPSNHTLVAQLGISAHAVHFSKDGALAYALVRWSERIDVIDTRSLDIAAEIQGAGQAWDLALLSCPPPTRRASVAATNVAVYHLASQKKVKAAVLSSSTFDATTVDVPSIRMGDPRRTARVSGATQTKLRDVDGDGRLDAEFEIGTAQDFRNAGAWEASTTVTVITAQVSGGQIIGSFPVTIVGK